jgi:hypothetical protein
MRGNALYDVIGPIHFTEYCKPYRQTAPQDRTIQFPAW